MEESSSSTISISSSSLTSNVNLPMKKWLWHLFKTYWRPLLLILTPLAALTLPLVSGLDRDWCAFMMILMGVYWVFELLPLAVTSLIPVVLCPLLGLLSTNDVSMQYMKGTNMLFIGALILATSIEESDLHRRIALATIKHVGSSPGLLMLGIMASTSMLSMWISNTATTAMMIPILEMVMAELNDLDAKDRGNRGELVEKDKEGRPLESGRILHIRAMLALSICYAANIGGIGTLVGTPPNVVMSDYLNEFDDQPVTFGTWMAFAVPQMLLCLAAAWLWLYIYFLGVPMCCCGGNKGFDDSKEMEKVRNDAVHAVISKKYDEMGRMSFHEVMVMLIFVGTFVLWFFLSPGFMTGWGDKMETMNAVGNEVSVDSATPAMLMVLLLFCIPSKPVFLNMLNCKDRKKENIYQVPPLLTWQTAQDKVAWGIILLLGGGFALAEASEQSCLSAWFGDQLMAFDGMADWALSLVGTIMGALLTQVVSNTAATSILLPVLRDLALALEINPIYLMVPPTLACSQTFMLPMSTGPNALCYGPSKVSIFEMIKVGFILNVICLAIITLAINTYGYFMFDLGEFPDWAEDYSGANDTAACAAL